MSAAAVGDTKFFLAPNHFVRVVNECEGMVVPQRGAICAIATGSTVDLVAMRLHERVHTLMAEWGVDNGEVRTFADWVSKYYPRVGGAPPFAIDPRACGAFQVTFRHIRVSYQPGIQLHFDGMPFPGPGGYVPFWMATSDGAFVDHGILYRYEMMSRYRKKEEHQHSTQSILLGALDLSQSEREVSAAVVDALLPTGMLPPLSALITQYVVNNLDIVLGITEQMTFLRVNIT